MSSKLLKPMWANKKALALLERSYLEPKETTAPTFVCSICKDRVPLCDKVEGIDIDLCSDCIGEYCEGKAQDNDVVASYIKAHHKDYLLWWFRSMSESEQINLLRSVYDKEKLFQRLAGVETLEKLEREFCLESDDFFEFVRGA